MIAALDKIFIFIAIVALPNLYFEAEYNVPLMLFCYAIWAPAYRPLIMYLLLFSWFIDGFRLFYDMSHKDSDEYRKKGLVIIIMVCLFILKILCIILLMIFNIECRNALNPSNMAQNFKSTFFPSEEEKQE